MKFKFIDLLSTTLLTTTIFLSSPALSMEDNLESQHISVKKNLEKKIHELKSALSQIDQTVNQAQNKRKNNREIFIEEKDKFILVKVAEKLLEEIKGIVTLFLDEILQNQQLVLNLQNGENQPQISLEEAMQSDETATSIHNVLNTNPQAMQIIEKAFKLLHGNYVAFPQASMKICDRMRQLVETKDIVQGVNHKISSHLNSSHHNHPHLEKLVSMVCTLTEDPKDFILFQGMACMDGLNGRAGSEVVVSLKSLLEAGKENFGLFPKTFSWKNNLNLPGVQEIVNNAQQSYTVFDKKENEEENKFLLFYQDNKRKKEIIEQDLFKKQKELEEARNKFATFEDILEKYRSYSWDSGRGLTLKNIFLSHPLLKEDFIKLVQTKNKQSEEKLRSVMEDLNIAGSVFRFIAMAFHNSSDFLDLDFLSVAHMLNLTMQAITSDFSFYVLSYENITQCFQEKESLEKFKRGVKLLSLALSQETYGNEKWFPYFQRVVKGEDIIKILESVNIKLSANISNIKEKTENNVSGISSSKEQLEETSSLLAIQENSVELRITRHSNLFKFSLPDGSEVHITSANQVWVKTAQQNYPATSWEEYVRNNKLSFCLTVVNGDSDTIELRIPRGCKPFVFPGGSEIAVDNVGAWVKEKNIGYYATPFDNFAQKIGLSNAKATLVDVKSVRPTFLVMEKSNDSSVPSTTPSLMTTQENSVELRITRHSNLFKFSLPDGSEVHITSANQVWVKTAQQNYPATSWEEYVRNNKLSFCLTVVNGDSDTIELRIPRGCKPFVFPGGSEIAVDNVDAWVKEKNIGYYATPFDKFAQKIGLSNAKATLVDVKSVTPPFSLSKEKLKEEFKKLLIFVVPDTEENRTYPGGACLRESEATLERLEHEKQNQQKWLFHNTFLEDQHDN